jgi:hypothetical protein
MWEHNEDNFEVWCPLWNRLQTNPTWRTGFKKLNLLYEVYSRWSNGRKEGNHFSGTIQGNPLCKPISIVITYILDLVVKSLSLFQCLLHSLHPLSQWQFPQTKVWVSMHVTFSLLPSFFGRFLQCRFYMMLWKHPAKK